MANSQIKTRIIHKHDVEANWELATNFIPKQGEIIIYDKDSTYNYERFKIGDGATLVSTLPFANDALKAEIQTLLNDKASVSSITQLSNEINNKVDKDGNKVLSTNDFTTALRNKLDGIEANANKTIVDTTLSSSSANPVQNKVINSALSGKQATITGAATTIASSNLTANKVLISNSSGKVAVSNVSSTELSYLSDVTSSIQEQFTGINNDIDNLDANKVDKVSGKGLSSNDFTSDYITKINNATTKLSGIAEGANKTTVDSSLSSTSTNPVQNKVINSALSNKVDKIDGKGLSTNDFTTTLRNKLDGIASGAQVNQNAFSNITDGTTTIAADSTTDTLTLVAGSNISLALDTTNDKVTISATNTTYSAAGSSLGLVKTGGDVTISNGEITVNDDSHNHTNYVTKTTFVNLEDKVDAIGKVIDVVAEDPDDETLDRISEIVEYTQNNKGLIDSITTSKQNKITGAATTITDSNLTASRVLVSDSNGKVAASSSITTTELGYLDGATSNLQTQITVAKNTADAKLAAEDITVTVTGTGNAITAASYDDNGTITLTKGENFNYYTLPTASSTLGGVKTTSTVTSASGYTPVPIIGGVPYYKDTNTTYSAATTSSAGLMSAADKTNLNNAVDKLNGIDANANNYSHPTYTSKTSGLYKITVDSLGHVSSTSSVSKADITALGIPAQDTTYSVATTATNGLMSAADKTNLNNAVDKLSGIAAGANKTVVDTALSSSSTNPVQNKVINSALSGKENTISLTASRALVSNTSGKIAVSSVTSTELGYLSGVTGSVQTQFNNINDALTSITDTKNTTGSTNTSSKIFLVGATSQAANPQTYSHDTTYVDASASLHSTTFTVNSAVTLQYNATKKSLDFVFA